MEVCRVMEAGEGEERLCNCPVRSLPPAHPDKIPFEPIESNIDKLKNWIVDRFKASAFNNCSHQKLPLVNGSPTLQLYLNESVRPVACQRTGNILLHFVDQVKADLDRDVRLW